MTAMKHSTAFVFSLVLTAAALAWACALPATAQTAGADLAKANGCMTCHDIAKKLVGPGFAQVAAKYKADAAAPAQLVSRIRGGSSGTWGRISMPPNTQVSERDAQALVQWILSLPAS
ncbi:c-type cytochrome [Xylophilus sp.]|uniref:c-type cytochrome n=1 Tax=Xylophilus sp. TaxID=2653893 RepID=UPI0013BCB9A3|nr:c-type cytochrome [Xylophilus sp.]KAF1046732.1 MAG: Cytochrome c-552 [Xylophilus sp.]